MPWKLVLVYPTQEIAFQEALEATKRCPNVQAEFPVRVDKVDHHTFPARSERKLKSTGSSWTEEETSELLSWMSRYPEQIDFSRCRGAILARFPGRSWEAIYSRRNEWLKGKYGPLPKDDAS